MKKAKDNKCIKLRGQRAKGREEKYYGVVGILRLLLV